MPTTISGNTGVSQVQAGSITASDLDGAQTGDAPIFGCRAWVNFDGTKDTTGATSTANTNRLIRASGNVTSVLRNGTGNYTITFTEAMPDENYCFTGSTEPTSGSDRLMVLSAPTSAVGALKTTTQLKVITGGSGGATSSGYVSDVPTACVAIFR